MTRMNNDLSICIPTYNRAKKLEHCLESLVSNARKYDVPIFISDNASSDNTAAVVASFQAKYDLIFYRCNNKNMGADFNIAQVLKMGKSRYLWLMSDDDLIINNGLDVIVDMIKHSNHDLVIVNAIHGDSDDSSAPVRVRQKMKELYQDSAELLIDLGWHTTWISCLVFGKHIIDSSSLEKYQGTNFVHFGTIFESLSNRAISVRWVTTPLISFAKNNVASYSPIKTYEIFAKCWVKIVQSLPDTYSSEAKQWCIKSHALNINIFTARWFLSARVNGLLSLKVFKEHHASLKLSACTNLVLIFTLCLIPQGVCRVFEAVYSRTYQYAKGRLGSSTRYMDGV